MVYDIGVAQTTPLKRAMLDTSDDLTAPLVISPLSEQGNNSGGGTFCYPRSGKHGPFFDPDSTLLISRSVARGYLVLLTGGEMTVPKVPKKVKAKKQKNNSKTNVNEPATIEPEKRLSGSGRNHESKELGEDDVGYDEKVDNDKSASGLADTAGKGDGLSSYQMGWPSKNVVDDQSVVVAFMALTDGNVIDACFGVKSHQSRLLRKTHADKAVRNAKDILRLSSETHDAVRLLAVEAYARCFEVVLSYHSNLDRHGIFGWCWKAKKIRGRAEKDLFEAFENLTGAVEASL